MKIIVETTNGGMLIGLGPESEVQATRPSVVVPSYLLETKTLKGEVRVLAQVSDAATDAEFKATWAESKGDKALAVESFVAMFPVVDEVEAAVEVELAKPVDLVEPVKAPEPAPKKAGKKSAEE